MLGQAIASFPIASIIISRRHGFYVRLLQAHHYFASFYPWSASLSSAPRICAGEIVFKASLAPPYTRRRRHGSRCGCWRFLACAFCQKAERPHDGLGISFAAFASQVLVARPGALAWPRHMRTARWRFSMSSYDKSSRRIGQKAYLTPRATAAEAGNEIR